MALIALTVLIARLVSLATGWMPIDPLLSAVVAVLTIRSSTVSIMCIRGR
jgi:Co/Zn/Cd efflux system component